MQIEDILINHNLVVITRGDSDPHKQIFQSDLLSKLRVKYLYIPFAYESKKKFNDIILLIALQAKITIIENWERNEISSSLVRILLRRGKSVKYLLNDAVIKHIRTNKLYS